MLTPLWSLAEGNKAAVPCHKGKQFTIARGLKAQYVCTFIHNQQWPMTCTATKWKYGHHLWFRFGTATKGLENWWQWEPESSHYKNSLPKHNSVQTSLLSLLTLHGYICHQNRVTKGNDKKLEVYFVAKQFIVTWSITITRTILNSPKDETLFQEHTALFSFKVKFKTRKEIFTGEVLTSVVRDSLRYMCIQTSSPTF